MSSVAVKIVDKDGKTVRTIDLGSQNAGNSALSGTCKTMRARSLNRALYTFAASTTIDGKATSLITNLPATVSSVTISQTGGELMLNLAGLGSIALSKVQTIGM